jgi:hypothetical protein
MEELRASLGACPRPILCPACPELRDLLCTAAEGFAEAAAVTSEEQRSQQVLEEAALGAAETITRLHGFFGETANSLGSLGSEIDAMRASLNKISSFTSAASDPQPPPSAATEGRLAGDTPAPAP